MRLTFLLALLATIVGTEVRAQQIILPCVPSGASCIPVSAANPLPTTGNTVTSVTIGTTTLTSGTDTRVLFQDGASPTGVLQENAALTFTKASGLLTSTGLSLNSCSIGTNAFCVTGTSQLGAAGVGVAPSGTVELFVQGATSNASAFGLYVQNSSATLLFAARNDGVLSLGGTVAPPTNNAVSLGIASLAWSNFFSNVITNLSIPSDTGLTDATVCVATTTGGGGVVGQYYKGTGTAGICLGTSSVRYKNSIVELDVGLPEIMKLRPVEYKLNPDHGDPTKPLYGFLAEDGVNVLPKLVGLDDQERPNTMDYLGVVPVLVRAMQQQQAQIDALKRSHP